MKNEAIKFLLLFSFLSSSVVAQNQTNIWYFSANAGLDFNSGTPVALTNGQINTIEGTASICDDNGVLLFYTDGVTVWDATHAIMSNGSGLNGNGSSSQSALIIKQPGNTSIYFIFTSNSYGGVNGTCYSVVDMNLNSGLGDVTTKNIQLLNSSTEKITAVNHANGTDVWVVTHALGSDAYYAYLLTATGIVITPVITNIGTILTNLVTSIGYLKLSHDGSKIAVALRYENKFELFDFNNATGTLSNYVNFPAIYNYAYGVEFSPDDRVLYTTNGLGPSYVYQFDLTAGSAAAITGSAFQVANTSSTIGAAQLATNGKIYVIGNYNNTDIDVINFPDSLGSACNYISNAVNLGGKIALLGLPNFNQSYFFSSFSFVNLCFGDSTQFSVPLVAALAGTQWNFGDPVSGINNISYSFNPVHYFTAPGSYQVELIKYYLSGNIDTVVQTVTINVTPVFSLGSDTVFCIGDSVRLDASCGATSYLWQNGLTDSVIYVSLSGNYYVRVSNGSCFAVDSVMVNTISCAVPGVAFLASDTSFCDKKCIDYTDLSTNNPVSWQWSFPGAIPSTSIDQNPVNICYNAYGSFDVTLIACNGSGCDTLFLPGFINEFALPVVPTVTINSDTLFASSAYSYQWYFNSLIIPGATDSFYIFQVPGNYFVIVTDSNGCAASSLVVYTGINDITNASFNFFLYPNPASEQFTLYCYAQKQFNNLTIRVSDVLGRIIFTFDNQVSAGQFSKQIKLDDALPGFYFVSIMDGINSLGSKKLLLIK